MLVCRPQPTGSEAVQENVNTDGCEGVYRNCNNTVESIMYDVEVLTGIDQPTFGIPFGQKPQHVYMILRTKLADFQAKYLASDVSITLQCIGLYQLSEVVVDLCGIFIAG